MNSKLIFILSLLLFLTNSTTGFSQEKVTLSGTVSDINNNEMLIGVNIHIKELNIIVATNEYGYYSISAPKGTYIVEISSLGFKTFEERITLTQNIKKNISLETDDNQLDEITLTTERTAINLRKPEMSTHKLSIAAIKKTPVVLGEVDIIRSLLQLPGVTNAGEGASGFNVRGGSVDQNLILLDEAIIYNSSHLFGFFSVFNPDAIKEIKLYKGGIPARYGGRLSSILDIYQKEGNSKEFHMNGGIGLISSRILAEGPIVKDRGSFLIGGRSSYAHLFLKLANNDNSAYFYDLNTKLSYKINDDNNVYLSGYFGRDVFNINDNFSNTYGNTVLNLRWNHLFSDKLFTNFSLIYSDYYYGLKLNFIGLKWDSGIKNYNLKYDFKHYISGNFKLNYGINAIDYKFNPGEVSPTESNSGINYRKLDQKYAFEGAAYIESEHELSDKVSLLYGIRYSTFYRLGSQTINVYKNNQAVVFNRNLQIYEKGTPIGTEEFRNRETIANFNNFEPRFAISYQMDEKQSIKSSYNRMAQYLQLITNTSSPTPLDIWSPSDHFMKPQLLDQYAIGYFRNFAEEKYSIEVETYYKAIQNTVDYIDGANLIANNAIEQVILTGKGRAYGVELLVRKNTGKLNGFISYTLSRTEQKIPGRTEYETGINNGEWYKAPYDKLHNLTITGNYDYNKKWSFGMNFSLQSGRPATFPNGQYRFLYLSVPSYGARNEDRLPIFHHLDLSATYIPNPNKNKGWQGEWVFGIYNLYNRKNAASIFFSQNEDTGINEAKKLSIFGIVPSVTYNFKF